MENKIVGYLVIGISVLIGFIIYSFNAAMSSIVKESCSHGASCPMWQTIDFQTNISMGIMLLVAAIGAYLVFFGKDEKIITRIVKEQIEPRKPSKENYRKIMGKLDSEERKVLERVIEAEGAIFQSELVEKTELNKVRITRILDRLEGLNVVERKRRGMTNVVVLKQ